VKAQGCRHGAQAASVGCSPPTQRRATAAPQREATEADARDDSRDNSPVLSSATLPAVPGWRCLDDPTQRVQPTAQLPTILHRSVVVADNTFPSFSAMEKTPINTAL